MDIIRGITLNVGFLFAFLFLLSFPNITSKDRPKSLSSKIAKGIIFGAVTIGIMLNAWEMQAGVIFDTRSVIISVVGLMFSSVTAVITAVFAIGYRIYVGDVGVYAGVSTIVFALLIGMLWRKFIFRKTKLHILLELYLFGLAVHIPMLLSQIVFRYTDDLNTLVPVFIVIMSIYPVATMLVAKAIINSTQRNLLQEQLTINEKKYRTIYDENPLGMIQYDKDGVIKISNEKFGQILHTDIENLVGLDMKNLPNKKLVKTLEAALAGETSIFEGFYRSVFSNHEFPTRVQFSPIFENDEIVGGIGIIQDLTELYAHQLKINELSRFDILTKVNNSISFDKYLFHRKEHPKHPISLAICDINTFQVINETFGYEVGDQLLIDIAKILNKYSSKNILVYRVGGDEFAMVMENISEKECTNLVSKVKQEISTMPNFNFIINVSFGCATSTEKNSDIYKIRNDALKNLHNNKIYDGSSMSKKTIDMIMTTLFDKSFRELKHSERVGEIASKMAKELNLGTAFYNQVALSGKLHDIGKINISEDILDKPGKLTDIEWNRIKRHPESGFRILNSVKEYMVIATIVLYHHEHYNGNGYPQGLIGHDIPLASRIIGIADAYDAMTEYRPYRKSLSKAEAIAELIRCKGTQFDPELVELFVEKVAKDI